jgi:hypothetical protein
MTIAVEFNYNCQNFEIILTPFLRTLMEKTPKKDKTSLIYLYLKISL